MLIIVLHVLFTGNRITVFSCFIYWNTGEDVVVEVCLQFFFLNIPLSSILFSFILITFELNSLFLRVIGFAKQSVTQNLGLLKYDVINVPIILLCETI